FVSGNHSSVEREVAVASPRKSLSVAAVATFDRDRGETDVGFGRDRDVFAKIDGRLDSLLSSEEDRPGIVLQNGTRAISRHDLPFSVRKAKAHAPRVVDAVEGLPLANVRAVVPLNVGRDADD